MVEVEKRDDSDGFVTGWVTMDSYRLHSSGIYTHHELQGHFGWTLVPYCLRLVLLIANGRGGISRSKMDSVILLTPSAIRQMQYALWSERGSDFCVPES